MKILDLLKNVSIDVNATCSNKDEAIDTLVSLMAKQGNLNDQDVYKQGIYAREELSTTGIGEGIAIPHAQSEAVNAPGLAAMVVKDGVDYQSLDNQPAKLFFMIAVPKTGGNEHLQILAMLSQMLMDTDFKDSLINAQSVEEFMDLINQKEAAQKAKEEEKEEAQKEFTGTYRLLAVTACPTGIAHTYMAAEAFEEKAKQMGITIKVETDGSGGTKNAPTTKEIEECEAIIVAADKNVEMARFNGKPVIQVKVADGINKAEELINEALSGNAPIYHADHISTTVESENDESVGRQIYKHLMNGVSHMLPFVIGGGILIAIAFLLDDYSINPANFGKNTPMAAFFKTVGEQAFGFMLPILAGYIAMSIADRPGLAVGFVGGVIAKDGYTFNNVMDFANSNPVSSGFLGALLAGFVAGYLVLLLKKIFSKLPASLEGIKPVLLYPVFGILLMAIFMMAVNPIMGAINTGLNNFLSSMSGSSQILLGAILAAMMAVDMGGPFNKAA